jgi:penicillin-binding protein 1C
VLPDAGRNLQPPPGSLEPLEVCAVSGRRAGEACGTRRTVMATAAAQEGPRCPWHTWIWTDPAGRWRVDAECTAPAERVRQGWFVLPPDVEAVYRTRHLEYRLLPSWRAGCGPGPEGSQDPAGELALVYPAEGARLLLPRGIEGLPEPCVCEASHRRDAAVLFWHLDGRFLGRSEAPHRMPVLAEPGRHRLLLVSDSGERLVRGFEVLLPR